MWLQKSRSGLGGPGGDATWITRCGDVCQAGEARALAAAARRLAAQPQVWAAGHADAIATLMRRALTRTRAPILSSLRRMVPQVALATFPAYPAPIFAIPGNHDGIIYNASMKSLNSFEQAFCTPNPGRWTGSGGIRRSSMTQPWRILHARCPACVDHRSVQRLRRISRLAQ